jgi:hypothetical protein
MAEDEVRGATRRRKRVAKSRKKVADAVHNADSVNLFIRRSSLLQNAERERPAGPGGGSKRKRIRKRVERHRSPPPLGPSKTEDPGGDEIKDVTPRVLLDEVIKLFECQKAQHANIGNGLAELAKQLVNDGQEDVAPVYISAKEELLLSQARASPKIAKTIGSNPSGNTVIAQHQAALKKNVEKMAAQMFQMMDSDAETRSISLWQALDFMQASVGGTSSNMPSIESITRQYDTNGEAPSATIVKY